MRATISAIVTAACVTACGIEDSGVEDGEDDAFTSADGKADGYDLTEAQALAVMHVAGTASADDLKAAGLSSRVATNITGYRAGKDKRLGTADDQKFDSLVELDSIPYVGPRTLDMLLAAGETSGAFHENALGRHDVSILIPLPASGDLPWKATTAGRGGVLLPRTVFDKIGRSVFSAVDDAQEYDALRVVGVRIDPCFTVDLSGAACQAQIRLVFQTLAVDRADGSNDGAIHALYNLNADQFADVVARLRALDARQNEAYQPLGVSPVLKAQGTSGAYAQALGALIAEYCGPATLARMTFVTRTNSRQSQWELGGFHVKAFADTGFPAAGPIKIIGNETVQVIGNSGFGGGIRYSITPGVLDSAGEAGGDATTMQGLTATQRKALQAWAIKQQAPMMTVPDTTDCASCHIAGHTSRTLEALDPALVTLDRGPRFIGGAETVGDNLRAFGYFSSDPVISIRTANETAAVLRALEAP